MGNIGPRSARPSAPPSQTIFFLSRSPFQWLNSDQEAVRETEVWLAKERRARPGELSMSITSDYLQFYSEDSEGKASNGTKRAVFIQRETSMSVFNSENIPRGSLSKTLTSKIFFWQNSVCFWVYEDIWAYCKLLRARRLTNSYIFI